ncbi:MAG: G5 domain-containing protein [Chloroflexota bacterium]
MSTQTFPRASAFIRVLFLFLVLVGCAPTAKRVVLLVDGDRRVLETTAVTVQEVLTEQNIALGDNDKVEPPPFSEVGLGATITVTRVTFKTETTTRPLPFTRQLVRDETYPQNQIRVVQLGTNGTVAITYAITYENGKETARRESGRKVVTQPKDEILAIGTQGSLRAIPLSLGTIVYIANGNAWVMRHSSGDKRALTTTGDLDGRVFSLSLDGRYLLFTRAADETSSALNSLWIVDTLVLGETPRALPVKDALAAQIAPDARSLVYSTGEKTSGAPGWKARNDLWQLPLTPGESNIAPQRAQQIWLPSMPAPYSWWGANLAFAPDGRALAYAFANEIGVIELVGRAIPVPNVPAPRRVLKKFAPFRTPGDWVWVPQVAWSPDSRFVVTTIHAPLGNPAVASDDPTFEVWALARDATVTASLAKQTGMWAKPRWSLPDARGESRIAFGVALAPSNSERSRYALVVMDRDGGNKQQIFPLSQSPDEGLTTMQIAWSPDARQLIAVRENDLWLYDVASKSWTQLTANGASAKPQWVK